jgi:hypothetical protein
MLNARRAANKKRTKTDALLAMRIERLLWFGVPIFRTDPRQGTHVIEQRLGGDTHLPRPEPHGIQLLAGDKLVNALAGNIQMQRDAADAQVIHAPGQARDSRFFAGRGHGIFSDGGDVRAANCGQRTKKIS